LAQDFSFRAHSIDTKQWRFNLPSIDGDTFPPATAITTLKLASLFVLRAESCP